MKNIKTFLINEENQTNVLNIKITKNIEIIIKTLYVSNYNLLNTNELKKFNNVKSGDELSLDAEIVFYNKEKTLYLDAEISETIDHHAKIKINKFVNKDNLNAESLDQILNKIDAKYIHNGVFFTSGAFDLTKELNLQ